jgi:sporulation protein YunB
MLSELAISTATDVVTYAVNEAIDQRMGDGSMDYDKLVTLEKTETGEISALVTNMSRINSLQSAIVNDVIKRLSDTESTTVYIPLGSVLGGTLLSGSGPNIKAKIVSVTSVRADFKNEFSDAGINQTRHQIMLNVSVTVGVLVPGCETQEQTVKVAVCIAETVIVGSVPDNYAYLG